MSTPHRSYLRPVDAASAAPSGTEARTRYFSSGGPARSAAGGRPPPLKVYSRFQGGGFAGGLRLRHVLILAAVAAAIVYGKSRGL